MTIRTQVNGLWALVVEYYMRSHCFIFYLTIYGILFKTEPSFWCIFSSVNHRLGPILLCAVGSMLSIITLFHMENLKCLCFNPVWFVTVRLLVQIWTWMICSHFGFGKHQSSFGSFLLSCVNSRKQNATFPFPDLYFFVLLHLYLWLQYVTLVAFLSCLPTPFNVIASHELWKVPWRRRPTVARPHLHDLHCIGFFFWSSSLTLVGIHTQDLDRG